MFDKLASNCSEDVTNSRQLTQKVRITLKMYKPDLCRTTLGLKAASSSFCRWLFLSVDFAHHRSLPPRLQTLQTTMMEVLQICWTPSLSLPQSDDLQNITEVFTWLLQNYTVFNFEPKQTH